MAPLPLAQIQMILGFLQQIRDLPDAQEAAKVSRDYPKKNRIGTLKIGMPTTKRYKSVSH